MRRVAPPFYRVALLKDEENLVSETQILHELTLLKSYYINWGKKFNLVGIYTILIYRMSNGISMVQSVGIYSIIYEIAVVIYMKVYYF